LQWATLDVRQSRLCCRRAGFFLDFVERHGACRLDQLELDAAQCIGMGRATLYKKIAALGIEI